MMQRAWAAWIIRNLDQGRIALIPHLPLPTLLSFSSIPVRKLDKHQFQHARIKASLGKEDIADASSMRIM